MQWAEALAVQPKLCLQHKTPLSLSQLCSQAEQEQVGTRVVLEPLPEGQHVYKRTVILDGSGGMHFFFDKSCVPSLRHARHGLILF